MTVKHKEVQKAVKEVDDILCNKCGLTCKDKLNVNYEFALLKASWGYGSEKDLTDSEAHLCEQCFDNIVKDFIISPCTNTRQTF
jgi:hypothetical protein